MKKTILYVLAVILLLAPPLGAAGTSAETDWDGFSYETDDENTYIIFSYGEETVRRLLGDVDNDGYITAADARIALRASSRLTELNGEDEAVADANRDGQLQSVDARIILRVSSRLQNINQEFTEKPDEDTRRIDPSKPMIALTFDDGPSQYTDRILNALERHDVRATFFTVGNLVASRKSVVLRAYNMGCEIAGHSWDHKEFTKLSYDSIKAQIQSADAAIEAVTGAPPPKFYRPPYGSINDTVKRASADMGYSIVCWSVDTRDWETRNADSVYNHIMNNAGDRNIIICHDVYSTTAAAIERAIPALIARGYQLVTVSELMQYSGKELTPGRVYYSGK